MADLTQLQSSEVVRVSGSDVSGSETNLLGITTQQEAQTVDAINNGAADTILNLTTTPIQGVVSIAARDNRKYVWMQGLTTPGGANNFILWGFSNSTQSFRLFKDQLLCFPIGQQTQVWFRVPTGTGSIAFGEGS